MASSMTSELMKALNDELNKLCVRVELFRAPKLPVVQAAEPPQDAAIWEGTYASLVLWPVAESDQSQVRLAVARGQDWIDAVLNATERRVPLRTADGYLVLALPARPSRELEEDIRQIELSTQVCRKHVIWPRPDMTSWERLAYITVLGIPDSPEASELSAGWPDLRPRAAKLIEDVEALGYRAAAERDLAAGTDDD